ncbi:MAG: BrnT family toxin, partial [Alphaproteobacteria bacterium]
EQKRRQNIAKHGVDFEQMAIFDWETALGYQDERRDYSEPRFLVFDKISGRLYACVYTPRRNVKRIISLRKANEREEIAYEKATQTTH